MIDLITEYRDQVVPSVYVIIPSKNGKSHLTYSLPSLFRTSYANFHVVLLDDGSTDGSLEWLSAKFPEITILQNSGGKGFAGTVNTGIRYALSHNASYVAIFNNDVQVLPEWLDLIVPVFDSDVRTGLVGFTEITKEREEAFFGFSVTHTPVSFSEVQGLAGCLYLCRAEVFYKVGLFDEGYFMYGEDNDFFYRLIAAGFKLIQTNVPVWHYGEGSSQKNKLLPTWLAYRNALRFSVKNEHPVRVVRMILSLLNQGCNPFLKRPADHPVFKRMRRYNVIFNAFLILGSCVWNLWHLRSTLKSEATYFHR